MARIRTWTQKNGIEIDEVEPDHDAHAFEVSVNGIHVVTIYVDSPEMTEEIRSGLDAGEDVRDWEDGDGHSIGALIRQRAVNGLRETLRLIEEHAGTYYNAQLYPGKDGTLWVDEVNNVYYEYETDDLDFSVDDLTDEDLKYIVKGEYLRDEKNNAESCWLLENGFPTHAHYFLTEKKYANTVCPFKVKSDERTE